MTCPIPFRKNLLGMQPYVPGKPIEELERELGIRNASKIASNENPLGPSPLALRALEKVLPQVGRYPDGAAHRLSTALAEFLGVERGRILLGNGSNELLVLLGQMVLTPGDEVLFAENSFFVYTLTAQLFDAVPRRVPLKDFTHDLQAFSRALTPRTRLVFICNPNNPTGTMVPLLGLEAFLKVCPKEVLVVLDEAYYEYVKEKTYFESLRLLEDHLNLVVLRTFSKAFGLAGLRVGYGVADPGVVEVFQRVRQPFNVNSMALAAAEASLGDPDHVRKVSALNSAMREKMAAGLRRLGLSPVPTQANFVYFQAPNASGLYQKLLRRGMIVRPMGEGALRVTTGTEEETDRFLRIFGEILEGRKAGDA
jgi:histidinol-phosphate aminotransferase